MFTLALPKGRLAEESIELLKSKDWLSESPNEKSKELAFNDPRKGIRLLLVRSQDVATYVEQSAADAGIAGLDVLREGGFDLLMPVALNIGKCRLAVASFPEFDLKNYQRKVRVATKYPKLAREFFFRKGVSCEIIKLYGSIELAPHCGLSDCIVDLVETGDTLRANGLVEKETILESSARVIMNRSSLYQKRHVLSDFIRDLT